MIENINNFSREAENAKKMGAYYTNPEHCRRIGYLFEFPDEEFCVLEPSIGDAVAISNVLLDSNLAKVFGVEINTNTYEQKLKENSRVSCVINGDFLVDLKISHSAFSFCFANPPYGKVGRDRLETQFVLNIYPYLKVDSPLALVVPYHILTDKNFLKTYMSRYEPLSVHRFDDVEYKKFKQVIVVGKKRRSLGYLIEQYRQFDEQISDINNLPYLPKTKQEVQDHILVKPSNEDDIQFFTSINFNAQEAAKYLNQSSLYNNMSRFEVPFYTVTNIGQPPVPLSKDHLYLLAISGGGQGLVGSEENKDLHLQRGLTKVVKKVTFEESTGNNTDVIATQKSFTKNMLTIIQNNGEIKIFE